MRNFTFQIYLRVAVIVLVSILLSYLWFNSRLIVTKGVLVLLLVYLSFDLVNYLKKANRRVMDLFEAIRYADFTRNYTTRYLGGSPEYDFLVQEVIDSYRKNRSEKEELVRYLETIVQHLSVGLVVFGHDGHIETVNTATKRLLNVIVLRNIKDLQAGMPALVEALETASSGDTGLLRLTLGGEERTLAYAVTEFIRKDQKLKLVSLKDIQSELQNQEFDAWRNLTRVLTHEIVNSITPIHSLSGSLKGLIESEWENDHRLTDETYSDLLDSLSVMERRSESLMELIDAYRRFSRLPKPDFKVVPVQTVLNNVMSLYRTEAADKGIPMVMRVEPETLEMTADPQLIEFVLINLTKNAIQAMEGVAEPRLELIGQYDKSQRVIIQVSDTGKGIIPEAIDKIFVPFFSTKQGGSGIGLSLSRQIMLQHRGILRVESEPGVKTVFTLRF
ncbi:MAG: GHKL domain-containing protein [Siphonobacter aquaeclarae]|jgi:two-component system nitrogen regulation sensor histidine kinase NtrY|nr:GHKL domain-containing protein [Siphonobacter aquaeclarae]